MKTSALKGLPVVGINDGVRLGTVEEVLLDPEARRVGALALGSAGHTRLLPWDQVHTVGGDAITADSAQATRAVGEDVLGQLPTLSSLLKLNVVDAAGTLQGGLADLEIDPSTGQIMELLVHQGGVLGMGGHTQLIPVTAIRSLGPQLVMVDAAPASDAS